MRVRLIHFSLISGILLLAVMPVMAQDAPAGQIVTKQDWISFMPVVIGSIVVVLLVDAFFILPIFRKNNQTNEDKQV